MKRNVCQTNSLDDPDHTSTTTAVFIDPSISHSILADLNYSYFLQRIFLSKLIRVCKSVALIGDCEFPREFTSFKVNLTIFDPKVVNLFNCDIF